MGEVNHVELCDIERPKTLWETCLYSKRTRKGATGSQNLGRKSQQEGMPLFCVGPNTSPRFTGDVHTWKRPKEAQQSLRTKPPLKLKTNYWVGACERKFKQDGKGFENESDTETIIQRGKERTGSLHITGLIVKTKSNILQKILSGPSV